MIRNLPLAEGETLIEEFLADKLAYWKSHLIMAVVLGAAAGLFLMWQGNPYPVAGPFGAVLAIGARAAYLASEALSDRWRLTERRLLGPAARAIPLAQIRTARPFLGAVQIVTLSGDKHLMKYMADPAAAAARILSATGRRA
ncbi:MAG: hypothetical protein WAT09_00290 [Paracoccaceae bacterium]